MDDNSNIAKSWNPGIGLTNLVTTLQALVISANTINQTLSKAFPLWTAGQIPGTTTNGDALAGNVGEYISSTVFSGSAIPLTTATTANITSISLTGGDWDVWGTVGFVADPATTATIFEGGINSVSATLPTPPGNGAYFQESLSVGAGALEPVWPTGATRISVSTTTTIYLVAQSTFAVNSMSAFGFIGARRRR